MQPKPVGIDWLSIGQLGLGGLSCLISFGLAIGLILLGSTSNLPPSSLHLDTSILFMLAGLLVTVGLLNIPSILLSWHALIGKPSESSVKSNAFHMASLALISLPFLLAGGQYAAQTDYSNVMLPIFNVLSLSIPIWWLVEFGRRELPSGSPQRNWGLLSASLGLIPLLVIFLEFLCTVLVTLATFAWLSVDPNWIGKLNQLYLQLSQVNFDPEFFASLLNDLLGNPAVIRMLFVSLGLLMPLIEELIKPLAVWFLRSRLQTPAEGFSAGLIAGAGFSLIESTTLIAQLGTKSEWGQMVLLRIATSLLHMTTSGLVGWGLVSGWTQKKYGRSVAAILASTCVHGLWNSLVVSSALQPVMGALGKQSSVVDFFFRFGNYPFAILLFFMAFVLVHMNHRLRRETEKIVPTSGE